MADKLLKYYTYISELNGLTGRMKLAQLTKIPSVKATFVDDNHENIELFKEAIEKITGKNAPDY
jgi:hypothetical protein